MTYHQRIHHQRRLTGNRCRRVFMAACGDIAASCARMTREAAEMRLRIKLFQLFGQPSLRN